MHEHNANLMVIFKSLLFLWLPNLWFCLVTCWCSHWLIF